MSMLLCKLKHKMTQLEKVKENIYFLVFAIVIIELIYFLTIAFQINGYKL